MKETETHPVKEMEHFSLTIKNDTFIEQIFGGKSWRCLLGLP